MLEIEKQIIDNDLSYDETIKLLNKTWNKAETKQDKKELVLLYCDISGSNPAEIFSVLNKSYSYTNVGDKKYRIFNPPTVSEQLDALERRKENSRKSVKDIVRQRNMGEQKYRSHIKTIFNDKIDINTATLEDFLNVKGIGEAKAKMILKYRDSSDGFLSIYEIEEIPGIGKAVFEHIQKFFEV